MDTLTILWHTLTGSVDSSVANSASGLLESHAKAMDMPQLLALAAAMGWASGMRLYLVLFVAGLAGKFGWIPLPAALHLLEHPALLAGSGFMLFVEFFVDKIPGVDFLWDIVHSVIRIPAGAALAAGVLGADSSVMAIVGGLLGGTLSATSFATKATSRAAVNTSPEPFSNIAVSLVEDGAVMGALWLATNYPVAFGLVLALVLVGSVCLMVVLAKYLRMIFQRVRGWIDKSEFPTANASRAFVRQSMQPQSGPIFAAKFCFECGAGVSTNAAFCNQCGLPQSAQLSFLTR